MRSYAEQESVMRYLPTSPEKIEALKKQAKKLHREDYGKHACSIFSSYCPVHGRGRSWRNSGVALANERRVVPLIAITTPKDRVQKGDKQNTKENAIALALQCGTLGKPEAKVC